MLSAFYRLCFNKNAAVEIPSNLI